MTDAPGPGVAADLPGRRPRVRRTRAPGVSRALVCLGDLMLDVVVRAAAPMDRGTDVAGEVRFRQGGSAANVARSFARLGGRSVLICGVGRDGWGERLTVAMRAQGVVVRPVVSRTHSTGRLAALVERDGERSFITERGAADELRPEDLRAAWFRGAPALHVPAYSLFHEPVAAAAIRAGIMAHAAGGLVSLDLASAGPLRAFGVTAATAAIGALSPDVLFANRDEAAVLLGGRRRSLATLLEVAPLVVVKEGADGCRIMWRDTLSGARSRLDVATSPVTAVDSTGAGDAFAAGFLDALLRSGLRGRDAGTLRRAALAGHRSASDLLRRPRVDLGL